MDREIPKDVLKERRRRLVLRIGAGAGVAALAVWLLTVLLGNSVGASSLQFGVADRGMLETSVSASGKVVPGFEEMITSPISARIVEVYRRAGDSVGAGTPLLRLDLQQAETEISRQRDLRSKQVFSNERQRLANASQLSNLEMDIRVKEMDVNRLRAEAENERRLDSIGSGTGDRVRQAEFAYNTGRIELEQLRKRLVSERRMLAASEKSDGLDLSIIDRNLNEQLRTLEDARLKSPRRATLTYINTNIGQQVAAGERVAAIADLTSFKIDATIGESNGKFVMPGGKAVVRIARTNYPGRITAVSPVSRNSAVEFTISLDDAEAAARLRPGLSAEVFVLRDVREDVVRIPLGPYYSLGPGEYELFVESEPGRIERRKVRLGEANYDFVEVVGGILPGERVVINDVSFLKGQSYKVKDTPGGK